jgi:hypothetical protein
MTAHSNRYARNSFIEAGAERLRRLCTSTGLDHRSNEVLSMFEKALSPWGGQPIGETPRWASEVGDDHTPYEFSVAFGSRVELRLLLEPLGEPPSLVSNRERALAVIEDLSDVCAVSTARLALIADLFFPPKPQGLFAVWLGVTFEADGVPDLKIYLNPQAQGVSLAAALVEEALVRLGFPHAWPIIAGTICRRDRNLDELKYFGLDLTHNEAARVKVYVRHLEATVEVLEPAAEGALNYRSGVFSEFVRAVSAVPGGPLKGRAPATCLSFVGGTAEPIAATLHFPVNGGYAAHDGEILGRVARYMKKHGLPSEEYERTLDAVAPRRLEDGIGIQSYASLRPEERGMRVTVYYPPELYHPGMIAPTSCRPPPRTPQEIVERFERESAVEYPFFRRLRREPVDLHKLWWLMANAQIGIINDFARRLAQVIAKVTDDRVRSILAHQLNDELGDGDFKQAHSQLFAKLLKGLEPWRPARVDDGLLAPGRELSAALESVYNSSDPFEGVGATMVIEILGRQGDQFIGDEFRRQMQVDPEALAWLNLHERLEVEHAEESMELANLVPAAAMPALWRGAERVNNASIAFYDALYGVCFSGRVYSSSQVSSGTHRVAESPETDHGRSKRKHKA